MRRSSGANLDLERIAQNIQELCLAFRVVKTKSRSVFKEILMQYLELWAKDFKLPKSKDERYMLAKVHSQLNYLSPKSGGEKYIRLFNIIYKRCHLFCKDAHKLAIILECFYHMSPNDTCCEISVADTFLYNVKVIIKQVNSIGNRDDDFTNIGYGGNGRWEKLCFDGIDKFTNGNFLKDTYEMKSKYSARATLSTGRGEKSLQGGLKYAKDDFVRSEAFIFCFCEAAIKIHEKFLPKPAQVVDSLMLSFSGLSDNFMIKDKINEKYMVKFKNLDDYQVRMLQKIGQLGFLHDKLMALVKSKQICQSILNDSFGNVVQKEVRDYYFSGLELCEVLKENLRTIKMQNVDERKVKNIGNCTELCKVVMAIFNWHKSYFDRLSRLLRIANGCKDAKGAIVLNLLHKLLKDKNAVTNDLSRKLLLALCKPYFRMICDWLFKGDINDRFDEFFIECNKDATSYDFWTHKYMLRPSMLPNFMSQDLALKLLSIGKSNILLVSINDKSVRFLYEKKMLTTFEKEPDCLFAKASQSKIFSLIDELHHYTTRCTLQFYLKKSQFYYHLHALKKYMLCGQGDFIFKLTEGLRLHLDETNNTYRKLDLGAILKNTFIQTNLRFESHEVLNSLHLDNLIIYDSNTGWHTISLTYQLNSSLLMLIGTSIPSYSLIFQNLYSLKQTEYICSEVMWKDQQQVLRSIFNLNDFYRKLLQPVMRNLQILLANMNQFIHKLEYYFQYDVIENNWSEFNSKVINSNSLDSVLEAYYKCIKLIYSEVFLNEEDNAINLAFKDLLQKVFSLRQWQKKLAETVRKLQKLPKKPNPKDLAAKSFECFAKTQNTQLHDITLDFYEKLNEFSLLLLKSGSDKFNSLAAQINPKQRRQQNQIEDNQ